MNIWTSPERDQLRKTVRSFAEREILPHVDDWERSGDKGGSANVGVWVRTEEQWRWLANTLTVELLKQLLPETAVLPVTRHLLPNLRAMNFVIEGILGQGVAYQARFDPQAKGLGEWLRSRHVDIPERLL